MENELTNFSITLTFGKHSYKYALADGKEEYSIHIGLIDHNNVCVVCSEERMQSFTSCTNETSFSLKGLGRGHTG